MWQWEDTKLTTQIFKIPTCHTASDNKILKTIQLIITQRIYLLHWVIHRHESLQPFPVEKVGELHVDGSHWACVLHDPVFVHIWCIVVAGGARRAQQRETRHRHVKKLVVFRFDGTCVYTVFLMKAQKSKKNIYGHLPKWVIRAHNSYEELLYDAKKHLFATFH